MIEVVTLPDPLKDGEMSLEEAFQRRRTVREFSEEPLAMEAVSQLLWSAQGLTHDGYRRTAPSAGATYPLELYLVSGDGIFQHIPSDHTLLLTVEGDRRRDLYEASREQEFILEAPVTLVFTAVFARTEQRYGSTRSPRYIHMEVGHAAQNVLLQVAALDLGAVPVGAFEDERVSQVMNLPADHVPLYMISIGHPR
jgi:SagB-type dehydrogenase family enzyme